MENTAYRNAMELLARRRSQAEKDAALRGAEDLRRVQADMAADRAGRDQLAARFRADNQQAASDIAAHQTRIDELTQQAETLREKLEKLAQEKLALEAQREQQSREGRQLNEALLNATQVESRLRQKLEGSAMEESQLLDKLWGYEYVGDTRTVDVHIKRLREKLNNNHNWSIATVWGIGYKFEWRS